MRLPWCSLARAVLVSRSSSFQLKPSDRDSQVAGKVLDAGHIVQGAAHMRDDYVLLRLR